MTIRATIWKLRSADFVMTMKLSKPCKIETGAERERMRKPKKFKEDEMIDAAWIYTGRKATVHIVLKPFVKEIPLGNGACLKVLIKIPQINLEVKP